MTMAIHVATALLACALCLGAEQSSLDTNLAAAARQIREDDSTGALVTLDRAEKEAPSRAALARINAYRAWAYLDLQQLSRAREAARQSCKDNANLVVAMAEFPAQVMALFEELQDPPADVFVHMPSEPQGAVLRAAVACDGQRSHSRHRTFHRLQDVPWLSRDQLWRSESARHGRERTDLLLSRRHRRRSSHAPHDDSRGGAMEMREKNFAWNDRDHALSPPCGAGQEP